MEPVAFKEPLSKGAKGRQVRAVQEWLCLASHNVVIDGAFGAATEAAVLAFQEGRAVPQTGTVDQQTHALLVEPMAQALRPLGQNGLSMDAAAARYAFQHLAGHPREVGGQNRGPWVRLYMAGREGPDWPWCAGFVSFVLRQASDVTGKRMPIRPSPSCDSLAASAKEVGRFVSEKQATDRSRVWPGCLALSRRTATDWVHVGLVVAVHDDHYESIEGNTNSVGAREGYEVCRQLRGYGSKDFIAVE